MIPLARLTCGSKVRARGERRDAKLVVGAAFAFLLVVSSAGCGSRDTKADVGAGTAAPVVTITNGDPFPTAPPLTAQLSTSDVLPGILPRVGVRVAPVPRETVPACDGYTLTAALFDDNSASLRADSGDDLTMIARRQKAAPGPVTIIGYTDARPTAFPGGNQRLSEARARSVRDALIGRGVVGIADVEGRGDREPVDLGTTEAAHRRNRRVEVTVKLQHSLKRWPDQVVALAGQLEHSVITRYWSPNRWTKAAFGDQSINVR